MTSNPSFPATPTSVQADFSRIPAEMRDRAQWVIAARDKIPLSVSAHGCRYAASSTDPSHWLSFDNAAYHATASGQGIGFVLTADDPYTCIDFDVKRATNEPNPAKWTHPDACEWFWEVAQQLDSYAEISRSGLGLHVWIRANIGRGRRRDNVEVYSQERFIICTGNVVLDRPIRDRQAWVTEFVDRYLPPGTRGYPMPDEPARYTDGQLVERIFKSEQARKFCDLFYDGAWQRHGYPSQSEGDAALLGILFSYSRNSEQLKRIFRMSALGRREKATKNDRYLDSTIQSIRQRRAVDPAISAAVVAAADKVIKAQRELIQAQQAKADAMARTLSALRN